MAKAEAISLSALIGSVVNAHSAATTGYERLGKACQDWAGSHVHEGYSGVGHTGVAWRSGADFMVLASSAADELSTFHAVRT